MTTAPALISACWAPLPMMSPYSFAPHNVGQRKPFRAARLFQGKLHIFARPLESINWGSGQAGLELGSDS